VQIVLSATVKFNGDYPGPAKPGRVFVFSDNLSWQSIDGTAVAGLAGTHSGTLSLRRIAEADDGVLANEVRVIEYEATFVLNAVAYDGQHLDAGQVTARGVWYGNKDHHPVDAQGQPVNERRYAVTGGTGPYRVVRGNGFETADGLTKTLEIDL
jgi:hypothetical protein